jgi:isopentenyl-diphosphate Delta-isomerase
VVVGSGNNYWIVRRAPPEACAGGSGVALDENVVLVDEGDTPVGVGEKLEVHRRGLLHRAFSVFGFSVDGELLLARRADGKYHSGGLWSNTCCGHPRAGEDLRSAARRRLVEELGLGCGELRRVGVLRYRARVGGLVENELDHVLVTRVDGDPVPDPGEVEAWRYLRPGELQAWLADRPWDFTLWFSQAWEIARGAQLNGKSR